MPTYELSTIKDIFDKVPLDRIRACMDELTLVIYQARSAQELFEEVGKAAFPDNPIFTKEQVRFPEKIVWNDDGKGNLDINFIVNDTKLFTIGMKVKEKEG